jgi:dTDP-4-amino-4,6-dideoxygalactose transaminase
MPVELCQLALGEPACSVAWLRYDAMQPWAVPLADLIVEEEEIEAVTRTLRSGWLTSGPETEAFEREFASYVGAAHAIATCNGTAALHLVFAASGLGLGDEVVVPSLTFVATINAVAYTGATPVFADIAGLEHPWLAATAVESALTPRTRAIVSMPYGGHPGESAELRALADGAGVALFEDAAHAAGARLGGRHLGTIGDAGAFSLFSTKNLAVGEGGIVVTDDADLAARIRLLRSHGMTATTWDRHRGDASGYDVVARGFNYRIDEVRATLGRVRLRRLEDDNRARSELDRRYRVALERVAGAEAAMPAQPSAQSSHHLFTVVLDDGLDRDTVRERMASRGVQTSVHYPAVHRFQIYSEPTFHLPVTDAYADRALTLPLFPHMAADQQDLVVKSLRGALTRD